MSFLSSTSSTTTVHSLANAGKVFSPAPQKVVPKTVSLDLLVSNQETSGHEKASKITPSLFQPMTAPPSMSLEELLSSMSQQTELCLCFAQLSESTITPAEQKQIISQIKQLLDKQDSTVIGEKEIGALLKLLTGSNGIQFPSALYAARPEVVLEIVNYAKQIGFALPPISKKILSGALALALQHRISTQLEANSNQVVDLTNIQKMIEVAKAYNNSDDIFDVAEFSRIVKTAKNRLLDKNTGVNAFIMLDYFLKFFHDNKIPYDASLVDMKFRMSAHAEIYLQQEANLQIKGLLAKHGIAVIQIEARPLQAAENDAASSSTMKSSSHADNLDDSGLELSDLDKNASSTIATEKPVTSTKKRAWLNTLPLGTAV